MQSLVQILRKNLGVLALMFSVGMSALLFMFAFQMLPIENTPLGLDWHTIWSGIQEGRVTFGSTSEQIGGFFTPPWGVLLLLPLGFLPFRESWGLFSFISILALFISVPRLKNHRLDILGIFLLVLSYPSLRNLADGNLEALVVAGVVLICAGYNQRRPIWLALGVLLAAVKFQETWLLGLVVVILVWRYWPRERQVRALVGLGVPVLLSLLLWGPAWVASILMDANGSVGLSSVMGRGSLIDITLAAALGRIGAPGWLIAFAWALVLGVTLWRLWVHPPGLVLALPEAAFLVGASMLLSPYVSGNSFLTIVAVGVIPLMQRRTAVGIGLILLVNLPFLLSSDWQYAWSSTYWTVLLLGVWGYTGWFGPDLFAGSLEQAFMPAPEPGRAARERAFLETALGQVEAALALQPADAAQPEQQALSQKRRILEWALNTAPQGEAAWHLGVLHHLLQRRWLAHQRKYAHLIWQRARYNRLELWKGRMMPPKPVPPCLVRDAFGQQWEVNRVLLDELARAAALLEKETKATL